MNHCGTQIKFVLPDLTVEQMLRRAMGKMKEMGFPGFLAGFFTREVPKLVRWKNRGTASPLYDALPIEKNGGKVA